MHNETKRRAGLNIPPRSSQVASPRGAMDDNHSQREKVKMALAFGLARYAKAMEELSRK